MSIVTDRGPESTGDAGDQRGRGDRTPIAAAHAEYRRMIEAGKEAWRMRQFHQGEADRYEEIHMECTRAAELARRRLVRAVAQASGGPHPDESEWFDSLEPFWTAVDAGLLFCLARAEDGDWPRDESKIADSVSLAVVDLKEIGGAP